MKIEPTYRTQPTPLLSVVLTLTALEVNSLLLVLKTARTDPKRTWSYLRTVSALETELLQAVAAGER
jgi:hypothetical protein